MEEKTMKYFWLFVVNVLCVLSCQAVADTYQLFWKDTDQYKKIVSGFSISEGEARALIDKELSKFGVCLIDVHPNFVFDSNYYYFERKKKGSALLAGVLVGDDGEIKYLYSEKKVKFGQRSVSKKRVRMSRKLDFDSICR